MDNAEALQLVEDCETRESRLSDWEREFIESLRERLDRDRGLSDRQVEVLEKIWANVTEKG